MKNKNVTMSWGTLIMIIMTTIFVVMKLCHVLTWSWLWVLAPLWIPCAIGLALIIIAGILLVIAKAVKK